MFLLLFWAISTISFIHSFIYFYTCNSDIKHILKMSKFYRWESLRRFIVNQAGYKKHLWWRTKSSFILYIHSTMRKPFGYFYLSNSHRSLCGLFEFFFIYFVVLIFTFIFPSFISMDNKWTESLCYVYDYPEYGKFSVIVAFRWKQC